MINECLRMKTLSEVDLRFQLTCIQTTLLTFFISSWQEYMDANKCIDELLKQLEDERRNVRR